MPGSLSKEQLIRYYGHSLYLYSIVDNTQAGLNRTLLRKNDRGSEKKRKPRGQNKTKKSQIDQARGTGNARRSLLIH